MENPRKSTAPTAVLKSLSAKVFDRRSTILQVSVNQVPFETIPKPLKIGKEWNKPGFVQWSFYLFRYTVRWMKCSWNWCCIHFYPILPVFARLPTRPSAKNRWCIHVVSTQQVHVCTNFPWSYRMNQFSVHWASWSLHIWPFVHARALAETKQVDSYGYDGQFTQLNFHRSVKKQGLVRHWLWGLNWGISFQTSFTHKKRPQKIFWILPTSSAWPFTVRSQELSGNLGGVLASNVVSMHDLTLRRNRVWEGWWNFVKRMNLNSTQKKWSLKWGSHVWQEFSIKLSFLIGIVSHLPQVEVSKKNTVNVKRSHSWVHCAEMLRKWVIRSGHFEALNFSVQDFVAWRRKAERTDLDHILRHLWMAGWMVGVGCFLSWKMSARWCQLVGW